MRRCEIAQGLEPNKSVQRQVDADSAYEGLQETTNTKGVLLGLHNESRENSAEAARLIISVS